MPRGGKRNGAGRKRGLDATTRAEIRREHGVRMQLWAAALAYSKDTGVKKNLKVDKKIGNKLARHGRALSDAELETIDPRELFERIPRADRAGLQAERRNAGVPNLARLKLDKRAWRASRRFIRELAQEHGVTDRMIVTCLNEKT